jgi:hypothetical protein
VTENLWHCRRLKREPRLEGGLVRLSLRAGGTSPTSKRFHLKTKMNFSSGVTLAR